MAIKTLYFKNAPPSGAPSSLSLQIDGVAPTSAVTGTGWVVGNTVGAGNYSLMLVGVEQVGTFNTTDALGVPSFSAASCWRTETPFNGTFANTNWFITFRVRAVTAAAGQTGRVICRIWKSVSPNGSGAVQLTTAELIGTNTGVLSTGANNNSAVTWNPGSTLTFTNEYLWIQCEWFTQTLASNVNADVDFAIDSSGAITTSDFTTVGAGTANGVGGALAQGSNAGVPAREDQCLILFEDDSGLLVLESGTGYLALETCIAGSVGQANGLGSASAEGTTTTINAIGSANGTGGATAIPLSFSGTGAANGTGAAQAQGASTFEARGSADGVGNATATNAVVNAQAGSADGVGTSSATGAAFFAASGNANGTGGASATSAVTIARAGTASGVGTASGIPLMGGNGLAQGIGTATGAGAWTVARAANANGTGAASATSAVIIARAANANGIGTANAVRAVTVGVIGNANGFGTASANGSFIGVTPVVGNAAGIGAASAFGSYLQLIVEPKYTYPLSRGLQSDYGKRGRKERLIIGRR